MGKSANTARIQAKAAVSSPLAPCGPAPSLAMGRESRVGTEAVGLKRPRSSSRGRGRWIRAALLPPPMTRHVDRLGNIVAMRRASVDGAQCRPRSTREIWAWCTLNMFPRITTPQPKSLMYLICSTSVTESLVLTFLRLFSAWVTTCRCDGRKHFLFWHRWSIHSCLISGRFKNNSATNLCTRSRRFPTFIHPYPVLCPPRHSQHGPEKSP